MLGSLDALAQDQSPSSRPSPSKAASWIMPGADRFMADGSTPLTCIVELRTTDGTHRADRFDPSRLAAIVQLDGQMLSELPPDAKARARRLVLHADAPPRPRRTHAHGRRELRRRAHRDPL